MPLSANSGLPLDHAILASRDRILLIWMRSIWIPYFGDLQNFWKNPDEIEARIRPPDTGP